MFCWLNSLLSCAATIESAISHRMPLKALPLNRVHLSVRLPQDLWDLEISGETISPRDVVERPLSAGPLRADEYAAADRLELNTVDVDRLPSTARDLPRIVTRRLVTASVPGFPNSTPCGLGSTCFGSTRLTQ